MACPIIGGRWKLDGICHKIDRVLATSKTVGDTRRSVSIAAQGGSADMAAVVSFGLSDGIDARHVRMARAGLGISVRDLAQLAQVNKATIVRLEAGMSVRQATVQAVKSALEAEGARFYIDRNGAICVSILAAK